MTAPASDSSGKFEEFRRRVLTQPALLEKLRGTRDTEEFISATVQAARATGSELTAEEINAALGAARRDWIERWLQ